MVRFFNRGNRFKLPKPRRTATWLARVIEESNYEPGEISIIFCTDKVLLKINQDYLNHDTLTDIITFDHSEDPGRIEGDIFISIDRVKENAAQFGISFQHELHRVMIHGVLHLLGLTDKTKKAKQQMRSEEDRCLSLPTVPRETF